MTASDTLARGSDPWRIAVIGEVQDALTNLSFGWQPCPEHAEDEARERCIDEVTNIVGLMRRRLRALGVE